ncbi:MAG: NAD-dependent succinate-semialdehyde dehydrogenase [Thaumarchaeota archaeon]|nr:NAD-dependent succinate-semialdehyde dehydrogenase [Nitrososphaerota archaeon]
MQAKTVQTFNPATGEALDSYEIFGKEKVASVAKKAVETFELKWSKLPIAERAEYFKKLASVLRTRKTEYGRIMTMEMGKPISQAEGEVEKCASGCDYYVENAAKWLEDEFSTTDAKSSYVSYEPLGAILSVMPWNFPFWQALRFAIPTVIAGNTSILRHSNVCPGCALAIEGAFKEAGFPDGVFSTVITDHDAVRSLIESQYIAGVSLTGSTEAGQSIGEQAARNFKKFVLELGGSDPFVVLDDADIDLAAQIGANARLQNSGQSCICAKRFIVVSSVSQEFNEKFVREFEKKKMGNPLDYDTYVGPLVNSQAVDTIDAQVRDAKSKGARVEIGGARRTPGAFFEPTVLDHVEKNMKVMSEEVFGPVAPLYIVQNETEALRVANETEFGLGASVWTTNLVRAKRAIKEIQSGIVFVNQLTKSDPRMPFGGVKKSGMGRELSRFGLREFVNIKSVNIYGIGN